MKIIACKDIRGIRRGGNVSRGDGIGQDEFYLLGIYLHLLLLFNWKEKI